MLYFVVRFIPNNVRSAVLHVAMIPAMNNEIEKEIFSNFLSESSEQLAELESAVIELESNPADRASVDTIFRCFHSLKGSSSIFGLTGLKRLAHTLESLMDRIRCQALEPTTDIISFILKGKDYLKKILGKLGEKDRSNELTPKEEDFLEELTSILSKPESTDAVNSKLHGELMKFLERPDIKSELENNEPLMEIVEVIREHSPNLVKERRANAQEKLFFEELDVSREYFDIKTTVDEVNQQNFSDSHVKTVFTSLDSLIDKHTEHGSAEPLALLHQLKEDLQLIYQEGTGFDELLAEITQESMGKYRAMLETPKMEKEMVQVEDSSSQPSNSVRTRHIKVDQAKLDQAISTAGEMVAVSEFFNYLQTQIVNGGISENLVNLKDAIASLQAHSDALSRELYDIRKVPIKEALQTLPRLVRDLQVSFGKKARLVMLGEDTPVDKGMVPKLETMFVHMVRNSIDHGLETPDIRIAAGKPEEGTLTLAVTKNESHILITFDDDGRGIEAEKVRQKLVASGTIRPEETESLSERELLNHIFTPGFSTSEKVTETSGRGVGMDVVNSYLHDMGGTAKVDNRPTKGVAITLSIPLTHTTLVKKGLAVAVGKGVYLIPIEMVLESFRPGENDITTIEGKGEMVNRRGEIFSLIKLHDIFNVKTVVTNTENGILVMVQYKRHKVCFLVDYVIGQRQIIYKQLAIKTMRQPSPFEGVSVYDGSKLAMILDVKGIIDQLQL